jgi:hypothetical protein
VVFALAAGMGFAVDLGGNVIGSVVIVEADSVKDSKIMSYGLFNRWRLEGSGENGDGTFGGWLRWESPWYSDNFGAEGIVWWKPIDQFKLSIGGNSDGIWGKEGFAGWMFKQIANDTSVVKADQAWGSTYTLSMAGDPFGFGVDDHDVIFRNAFFGGFGGIGLMFDVKPVDMFGINIAIPFINETGKPWSHKELADIFKKVIAQIDLNLDFGNIALTYVGGLGGGKKTVKDPGHGATYGWIYSGGAAAPTWGITNPAAGPSEYDVYLNDPARFHLYFGLTAIDNLSLDVGIGYSLAAKLSNTLTYNAPMAIGLAAKYNISDSFGIKARVLTELAGSIKATGYITYKTPFALIFEVLPFFAINDSVTVYADLGLNMVGKRKYNGVTLDDKAQVGFHINPYVGIGSEWGPTFFVGLNVYTTGEKWTPTSGDPKTTIFFEFPIALNVSF